jgi:hypothetical protein
MDVRLPCGNPGGDPGIRMNPHSLPAEGGAAISIACQVFPGTVDRPSPCLKDTGTSVPLASQRPCRAKPAACVPQSFHEHNTRLAMNNPAAILRAPIQFIVPASFRTRPLLAGLEVRNGQSFSILDGRFITGFNTD